MKSNSQYQSTQPQDKQAVKSVIQAYFDGLHKGDINKLKSIFSEDCVLKAPGIRRDRSSWLSLVEKRKTPSQSGHDYHYQILSLELNGEQAMVKVSCPLLGSHFIDYLGLLKENDQWLIVNKMYADKPTQQEKDHALR